MAPAPPKAAPHGRLWAADRRRSLVVAAARLLVERGADAVRIPDVAAAAGVTRPVVYKHFPNRTALCSDSSRALESG